MIGHQTVGVINPVVALINMLKGIEEVIAVLIVLEDGFLLVAAGSNMVNGTGIFSAEGTDHNVATVSQNTAIIKVQDMILGSDKIIF